MKLTKIAEDIHLYENFITKEECKNATNLLDHMASLDKDFYKGIYIWYILIYSLEIMCFHIRKRQFTVCNYMIIKYLYLNWAV